MDPTTPTDFLYRHLDALDSLQRRVAALEAREERRRVRRNGIRSFRRPEMFQDPAVVETERAKALARKVRSLYRSLSLRQLAKRMSRHTSILSRGLVPVNPLIYELREVVAYRTPSGRMLTSTEREKAIIKAAKHLGLEVISGYRAVAVSGASTDLIDVTPLLAEITAEVERQVAQGGTQ
jgi:hypothetical protein